MRKFLKSERTLGIIAAAVTFIVTRFDTKKLADAVAGAIRNRGGKFFA